MRFQYLFTLIVQRPRAEVNAGLTKEKLAEYQVYRSKCRKTVNTGKDRKTKRLAKGGTTIAASTIAMEVAYIVRMLKHNGFMVERPPKPFKIARREHKGRPFTKTELAAFFKACNEYPQEEPGRYTPLFLLMLCTGARPAELVPSDRSTHVALLKKELNLEEGTVKLRAAKVHNRDINPGKTSRIPVAPEVLQLVKKAASKVPGVHVFPPMTIHHVFNQILKKAGLDKVDELGEKLTAHSFRHTYGTLLANSGVCANVIQNVMRHSDPKMTALYTEKADEITKIDPGKLIPGLGGAPSTS